MSQLIFRGQCALALAGILYLIALRSSERVVARFLLLPGFWYPARCVQLCYWWTRWHCAGRNGCRKGGAGPERSQAEHRSVAGEETKPNPTRRYCNLAQWEPESSVAAMSSKGGDADVPRQHKEEKQQDIQRRPLPKYLAQQWAKASGRGEVGKLRIAKNQGKTEVSFTLSEELASIQDIGGKAAPSSVTAPREHPFQLQSVGGQTLTVFTESLSGQTDDKSEIRTADKLAIEGIVVQRAECRPAVNEHYMQMKRLLNAGLATPFDPSMSKNTLYTATRLVCMYSNRRQIEESSKPKRQSQQIDKAVTTNYKPVANHQYNIEYEKKKKDDGKRARADRQQVLDMLFSAFEKHQYYNIKDLVDITKQPVTYLKEILRDIGIYNVKGTHKNTWELKPEYRHYQAGDKSD
uniref:General transcription factor IIF subunit 2 n=1 Tax=Leptobrachium leishanense TaxID=445787 RepID=A0A8C5WFH3_9ANUR